MDNCLVCTRIKMIQDGTNKHFVAELDTGYVVLGDHQYFEGYTLFLCKEHKNELHELDSAYRQKFLYEMSQVSEAVYRAIKPDKLNYELLGNGIAHMHWHIFPRRVTEPHYKQPVWLTPKDALHAPDSTPNDAQLEDLKSRLLTELQKIV